MKKGSFPSLYLPNEIEIKEEPEESISDRQITIETSTKEGNSKRKINKKCSLKSCTENQTDNHLNVLFHRIPSVVELSNEWKTQCGISKKTNISKRFSLCNKHFLPTDYRKGLQAIFINVHFYFIQYN